MRLVQVLAISLCAMSSVAYAQTAAQLSPAQRSELKVLIGEYIRENPGVIADALMAVQEKQGAEREKAQKETFAKNKDELQKPKEQTVLGNPKGNVTIVEFFDYSCGYCKSLAPTIAELIKADPQLRVVMKEMPILGPNSLTAAKAALASRKQKKYAEFNQAMLMNSGQVSEASIFAVATKVGLNVDQLRKDMNDPEIQTVIDKNLELAKSLQISGTPAMFVNDKFIPGAVPKEDLIRLIADARTAPAKSR